MLLAGCIKNDIPLPTIQAVFTAFEVDGAARSAKIDAKTQTVTVYLSEQTDPRSVRVDSVAYNAGEPVTSSLDFASPLDLSSPRVVTLSLYQDYAWTIRAEQDIERYFEVGNQVGDADIDYINHRVVALVTAATDVSQIEIKRAKLGPADITVESPAIASLTDFTSEREVDITFYGQTQHWTIYVVNSTSSVEVRSADAWTRVAWITASGVAGADNGILYRRAGSESWTAVPSSQITSTAGGTFTALVKGLEPLTEYEYCAYSGDDSTDTYSFTTEEEAQIPNSSFDEWHLSGKVWNPWPEDGTKWWDTGNRGATTIGDSNTTPSDDTCPANPTGKAASLASKYTGVIGIGKLAAGNIYVGEYVKTDGMNGILNFGREFTVRPTRLTGYYKYHPAPINYVSDDFADMGFEGKNDTCNIYIMLGDWSVPVEIRTKPSNRKLIDLDDPNIIAYGALQTGEEVGEYTRFEVELEYRSTSRKPRYLLCVASASKYGDYFTGGDGSLLVVDEFQLEYDY